MRTNIALTIVRAIEIITPSKSQSLLKKPWPQV